MSVLRFGALAICAAAFLGGCGGYVSTSQIPSRVAAGSSVEMQANRGASAFTVLHVFRAPPQGQNPLAPVIADAAGNIFGETNQGGHPTSGGGCGTAFEMKPSGTRYVEITLHSFRSEPDGCGPSGGLTIDSKGAIYGTTEWGGTTTGQGAGTVFKLTPSGTGYKYAVIYRFKNNRDGAWPVGSILVSNGVVYGATQYGASYACAGNTEGCGTVYKLTPSGNTYKETILYVFKGGDDGLLPIAGVAMDASGALYGTTQFGGGSGSIGEGTVYKLTPSGSDYRETVIHAFDSTAGDGSTPWAPVIVELNGAVMGTTLYGGGGSNGGGIVFRLTPSGSKYQETILYRFTGAGDGSQPEAPVIEDRGVLFGTTTDGADGFPCRRQCGTIYELRPNSSGYQHTVLYAFRSLSGYFPRAGVILRQHELYGTTYFGGNKRKYAAGTVFRLGQP
jgi:uncharacterized repeat protein (TIGR03803 family)